MKSMASVIYPRWLLRFSHLVLFFLSHILNFFFCIAARRHGNIPFVHLKYQIVMANSFCPGTSETESNIAEVIPRIWMYTRRTTLVCSDCYSQIYVSCPNLYVSSARPHQHINIPLLHFCSFPTIGMVATFVMP
jgi:hypothetical protein